MDTATIEGLRQFESADVDELAAAAERYIALGWQCVPGDGKSPNVVGWPEATFTPAELEDHWNRAVEPALCVKFGAETGMVDFEFDNLAQEQLMLELFGGVPSTLRFRSRKGEHWLFEWDARLGNRHVIPLPAADGTKLIIRCGNAAQSVFPPSRHKEWIVGPDDGCLQTLPESVIQRLLAAKPEPVPLPVGFVPCSPDVDAAVEAMLRIEPKEGENDGSGRLYSWGCRAIEHNLDDAQTVEAVKRASQRFPFPKAYSEVEILQRVRDAESSGVIRGAAKPVIAVNGPFSIVHDEIEQAIGRRGVFDRNGCLVRIGANKQITPIHPAALIRYATDAADFVRVTDKGEKPALPTERQLKALYHAGEYRHVRELKGVSINPILLPDGGVVSINGYDPESGYYLHLEQEFPAVMPTQEALTLLVGLYDDFPTQHVAGFVSYLLTLAARTVIDGPTPLFAFDGNHPGCGKGLSVDMGSMLVDGCKVRPCLGFPDNAEMAKYLLSQSRIGPSLIAFDNVDCPFEGAAIEAAITTQSLSGRLMRTSDVVCGELNNVWAATGNGMTLSRDMQRRTIAIQIDAPPNPHLRTGFKHPDLLGHIRDNRPLYYMAALSIVANHIRAGSPPHGGSPMGSFEAWDRVVRSAVINAGLSDPFEPSIEVEVEDPEVALLHKAWAFTEPTTVAKAVTAELPELSELLKRCPHERVNHWLGNLLRRAAGVKIDGKAFAKSDHKQAKWSLL